MNKQWASTSSSEELEQEMSADFSSCTRCSWRNPLFSNSTQSTETRTSWLEGAKRTRKKADKNTVSKGIKGTWFLLNSLSRKSTCKPLGVAHLGTYLPTRSLGTLNFLNARYTPPATLQLVACAHCPGQQGQLALDSEFKKIGQGLPARKQSET